MSPTQLSLKLLRSRGYLCDITEHWNHFARQRKDLFGFVDVLALGKPVLAIQTTSSSNVSARLKKIRASEAYKPMLDCGFRIYVHGWKKNKKGRWECREVLV